VRDRRLGSPRPTRTCRQVDRGADFRFRVAVDPIRFASKIRHWNPERASGLAVADIPAEHIRSLGGLKQVRVRGAIGGAAFVSNVMPAGGGRLALSVSKAMMAGARVAIGDVAEFEITGIGRD
jgi:hypothetical protein